MVEAWESAQRVRELATGLNLDDLLGTESEPFLLRGLATDWPLVHAGRQSSAAARNYLLDHARDRQFTVNIGEPAAGERLFYRPDMQMNFRMGRASLADIFRGLEDNEGRADAPVIYLSSIDMVDFFEGLHEANCLNLGAREPLASIWIGNRTRIAPHNDVPNNVAVCVAGTRRFTLFPPDQFANLYLGPVDHTPAGRPVSMVDWSNPDFDRFPRAAEALAHAQVAELEPGDAIFIPSLWWHQVEALGAFNILVNYWWRDVPRFLGNPQDALYHAMLAIRDLDPAAKDMWKALFDYYVFENGEKVTAHIPEGARGVLDPNAREPLASIWIGNRTRIAPHNDVPNNVAVCVAGTRRFTLFPPDQFANLYLGPVDHTPAGRPVSMVDWSNPDFDRFPRAAEALAHAQVAELEPGDAIFIPSLWWHQVEALGAFNILVNYWWRDVPRFLGNPQDALYHAMLAIRDLDPAAKDMWKALFDYYVFENGEKVTAHIPEGARGVLDPLDAEHAGKLRANILHGLSR